MLRTPFHFLIVVWITLILCQTQARAQAGRTGRSSTFTEIKWDVYTFKFLPGNQMAQVLDADGQVIGTILAMNGTLQVLPTVTGDAGQKLKQSFQAWKDQGGEKALSNPSTARTVPSRSATMRTPASQPSVPASTPATPTPSAATVQKESSQSGHGILHAEDLEGLENGTVRFDLNAMRVNPSLLQQKPVMQYFIALNNCNDSKVERALQNELDYPELASFYSGKAAEILSGLPDTAGLVMYGGDKITPGTGIPQATVLWGRHAAGNAPIPKTLTLGEYDLSRKVFPIVVSDKSKTLDLLGTQRSGADRASLEKSCPVGYNTLIRSRVGSVLPNAYTVTVPSMTFSELPMSEADARKYIEGAGSGQRNIVLAVDLHLKPGAKSSTPNEFAFDGTIARVMVMNRGSFQPIAALYDDHSLAPIQVKTIPSAITTMKSTREFNEEVITAVYVSQAADACGWPISPEQKANLKRYISDVDTYGKFNDRSTLNGVMSNVRNGINDPSRHFCENATERQDFDRRAATVWPKGPMAAPAPPAN